MSTSPDNVLRILLLGNVRSPFVIDLARYLKSQETVVIGLVSHSAPRDRQRPEEILDDFYTAAPNAAWSEKTRALSAVLTLIKIIRAIWRRRGRYDCLHIHYFSLPHAAVAIVAGFFFRRRMVTIYGSDFYRANRLTRLIQRRALSSVDLVTVTNHETGCQLRRSFGRSGLPPIVACRFGLTPLAELRKAAAEVSAEQARARFGIPPDGVVVTCAYNRSPAHRHLAILEQLGALPQKTRDSLFLVMPLTYGGVLPGYVDTIKQRLVQIGVRHLILDSYLSNREIAELRLATDVFIHVPVSDQLSGTMQEHMFAGSIVVTGSWLPYAIFREMEVEFLEIAQVEELAPLMPSVLDNLEDLKFRARANRRLIWDLSNWDSMIRAWVDIYRNLMTTSGDQRRVGRRSRGLAKIDTTQEEKSE